MSYGRNNKPPSAPSSAQQTLSTLGAKFKSAMADAKLILHGAEVIDDYEESHRPPVEMRTMSSTDVATTKIVTEPQKQPVPASTNYYPNDDRLTESTFHVTPRPERPKKNKSLEALHFLTEATKTTSHKMRQAYATAKPKTLRFFKYHDKPYMAELEAINCQYYRFIAPDYAPTANAHYDSITEKIIGVCSRGIPNFKDLTKDALLEKDLNNPEIIKGLAIGLTTSYIFEEDDLHRCNLNKYGQRVDFDMSSWPILYDYKQGGPDVKALRNPEGKYSVTEYDIVHFPNLVDAKPYFWPATPAKITQSSNAFTAADTAVFRHSTLEKHPVFIYHKFKTMLKYILTDEDMYRNIAKLHISEDIKHKYGNAAAREKSIVDILAEHQAQRIKAFRETLIKIPEFLEFLQTDGPRAITEIMDEFDARNKKLLAKVQDKEYLVLQFVTRTKISTKYQDIYVEAFNYSESHPVLGHATPEKDLSASFIDPPRTTSLRPFS